MISVSDIIMTIVLDEKEKNTILNRYIEKGRIYTADDGVYMDLKDALEAEFFAIRTDYDSSLDMYVIYLD